MTHFWQVFESKPRIVPGKLQNIFTLSRSVEEDEKEPEGSAPAPSKGNVFQFLQQKQRQVRDEQEEERIAERQRKVFLSLISDLSASPFLQLLSLPLIHFVSGATL